MEVKIEKTTKYEVTIAIDKNEWEAISSIIQHNKLVEVIAFNAIERVGSSCRKKFCFVEYTIPSRAFGILDTLKAIGIKEYIKVKSGCTGSKPLCIEYVNDSLQRDLMDVDVILSNSKVKSKNLNKSLKL